MILYITFLCFPHLVECLFFLSMDNLHLDLAASLEEDEHLILEPRDLEVDNEVFDHCLVGLFLTNQTINFSTMRTRMARVWKPSTH